MSYDCVCNVEFFNNEVLSNSTFCKHTTACTPVIFTHFITHLHYTLQADSNLILQVTKPYSADILSYLMKGHYFNGSK